MADGSKDGRKIRSEITERIVSAAEHGARSAASILKDATGLSGRMIQEGIDTAETAIESAQRRLGEDYFVVLEHNPIVESSFDKAPLLTRDKDLLGTAFNIPWKMTALWMLAAGVILTRHHGMDHLLGQILHYGPGHVAHWSEINSFMDTAIGSGHRLKFGHTIDFLPDIVERFGWEGAPAFFTHLLQDAFTVDGIPVFPHSWALKHSLVAAGMVPKTAASLLAITAAETLGVALLAVAVTKATIALKTARRRRHYLKVAAECTEVGDLSGAAENYKRALALEQSPGVLMALGQVYVRRKATRIQAYQAFKRAMDGLATDSLAEIEYGGGRVSLRGTAGLQALSTIDVLGDRYPQSFDEEATNIVNGTVASFKRLAEKQEAEFNGWVRNALVAPPIFSAAINRFFAAQAACQYPLLENRGQRVRQQTEAALRDLALVAQYDEHRLRSRITTLREIWARTVLPSDEAETALAFV